MNEEQTLLELEGSDIKRIKRKRLGRLICACVLAAVLLINAVFGIIIYKKTAYIDLTRAKYEEMSGFYTFSDSLAAVMDTEVIPSIDAINSQRANEGLDALKVEIIFCRDADLLEKEENTKMVHHTARELESRYPDHFEIIYTDVQRYPASVQKYKVTSATTILPTDVIISFGTEFNVHGLVSFYTMDTDTGEVWAYNGEKKFASTILSLTRADSPVCALTVNHGEGLFRTVDGKAVVKEEYSTFIDVIKAAGYKVTFIDLERDEIPENCRMIICFAPTTDFKAFGSLGETGVSEISKLDKYLDGARSFFYVCDTTTPELKNLEEYLSEWGIQPTRVQTQSGLEENYALIDEQNSTGDNGALLIGKYVTAGYGASITADLRASSYPPAVAFGSSTALSPSENYTKTFITPDDGSERSVIYSYYNNGVSRTMYDIFTANSTAYAKVGGEVYEHASDNNLFRLLTLTEELKQVQEDNYSLANLSSYVLGASSTEFFKNEFLNSAAYGNSDVLLAALRATSTETVPVNLEFKVFDGGEINETVYAMTNKAGIIAALCLTPVSLLAIVGIFVCVRRKYL